MRFDLALGGLKALTLLPDVLAGRKEAARSIVRKDKKIKDILKKNFK